MHSITVAHENKQVIPVILTDIGDGGVGSTTKGKLTIGDVLSFHLLLPGADKDIYVQARVLWTRDHGAAACEFVRIPPVDAQIPRDWLKHKSPINKPLIEV
jgi:hypothetical protein